MDKEEVKEQEIANKKMIEGIISVIPTAAFAFVLYRLGTVPLVIAGIAAVSGSIFFFLVYKFPSIFRNRWLYLLCACLVPGGAVAIFNFGFQKIVTNKADQDSIVQSDSANYDRATTGTSAQTFAGTRPPERKTSDPILAVSNAVSEFGFTSPRSSEPLLLKVHDTTSDSTLYDIEAVLTVKADPAQGSFTIPEGKIFVTGNEIKISPGTDWGVYSLFVTGKCKSSEGTRKLVLSVNSHVAFSKSGLEDLVTSSKSLTKGNVAYDRERLVLVGDENLAQVSFLHGLMMPRPFSMYFEIGLESSFHKDIDVVTDLVMPNGITVSFRSRGNFGGQRGMLDVVNRTILLPLSSGLKELQKIRINFDGQAYSLDNLTTGVRLNLGSIHSKGWSGLSAVAIHGCKAVIKAIAIGSYTPLENPVHQYSIEDRYPILR